jgi:hypothetical protein|tara:strand:- start:1467 stop:1634 length:168 start_codon:yes stop_codon:yes gene_type:complete
MAHGIYGPLGDGGDCFQDFVDQIRPVDVEWRYCDTGRAVPAKIQAETTAVLLKYR